MHRTKKLLKLAVVAICILATTVAATNGYSDIRNMNRVEGISVSSASTNDFSYTTTKGASPDTPSRVSIVSNVDPVSAEAGTSQTTRAKTVPATASQRCW